MRFSVLSIVWYILLPLSLNSQSYNLSNKSQISQKKHIYHTVIGESEWGIYTVNYTEDYFSGGFSIERYDQDLGFIDEKVIHSLPKGLILDIFHSDSFIFWVTAVRKRREPLKLYLSKIRADLEGDITNDLLGNLPIKQWNPEEIKFSFDPFLKHWSVAVMHETSNDEIAMWVQVRDLQGNLKSAHIDTLQERFSRSFFSKYKLGSNGDVLALVQFQKRSTGILASQKNTGIYIFHGSEMKTGFTEWNFTESPQSSIIQFDRFRNEWTLISLFGNAPKEIKGMSVIKLDYINQVIKNTDQYFSAKTASILEGAFALGKRKTPAISNFICRRIIPQKDGGSLLLVERYNELKQLETYYLNGIPQTATKLMYHYDEIGALFLDSNGYIDTVLKIEKEQAAAPVSAYLLGFGSFVCEKGVHLVFNGDISKNNDIKQVIIRPDYSMETHTLVNSDNFYHAVVPFDGMESEYCTYTVPLLRDRQWFWMQIKERD